MDILDLPLCAAPYPLPENATEEQKLQYFAAVRTYRLCQIQSAQKHMEFLATEIAKDSTEAGILTRTVIRNFREIEMAFLSDIRGKISAIVNKPTSNE